MKQASGEPAIVAVELTPEEVAAIGMMATAEKPPGVWSGIWTRINPTGLDRFRPASELDEFDRKLQEIVGDALDPPSRKRQARKTA